MIFGNISVAPEELARLFIDHVAQDFRDRRSQNLWKNTDSEWTDAVKNALRKIGENKGFCVRPSDEEPKEHLLDLIWQSGDPDHDNDILLAVESEWGAKNLVWEDFEKLMQIKAPIKLMVWSTNNHEQQSTEVLDGIAKKYMEKFHQHVKGEDYLLVEFNGPECSVYCYHYNVPKDGKIENVRFAEGYSCDLPPTVI